MRHNSDRNSSGQTIIALLIFMMMIITLTVVAATVTIINVRSNNAYADGEQALAYAESGAEDALLHLSRDPNYTGETISFARGTATINVSGTTVKTIVSEGTRTNNHRRVTVVANNTNNVLTPTSWSETP